MITGWPSRPATYPQPVRSVLDRRHLAARRAVRGAFLPGARLASAAQMDPSGAGPTRACTSAPGPVGGLLGVGQFRAAPGWMRARLGVVPFSSRLCGQRAAAQSIWVPGGLAVAQVVLDNGAEAQRVDVAVIGAMELEGGGQRSEERRVGNAQGS